MTVFAPVVQMQRHRPSLRLGLLDGCAAAGDPSHLAARLRRVLTANPGAREFSVQMVIDALQLDATASLALFSAAGVFEVPGAANVAGRVISSLGANLALGRGRVVLSPRLLRRKIPRNALLLLVEGIVAVLNTQGSKLRQRWSWVFHPAMSVVLGLTLFLLGVVSMTPVIGGGIQHAASAFVMSLGLAERDGLTVMIGAVAAMASIGFAIFSVVSGQKLWRKAKAWLVRCVRRLHMTILANLLDSLCNGLGDLMRIRWQGLLLLLTTSGSVCTSQMRRAAQAGGTLKQRVRLALLPPVPDGAAC